MITEWQLNFLHLIKARDEIFRRHARVHPEKVHIDRDGPQMGEAVYTLYNQNIWPEISGPSVWKTHVTYWTYDAN